MFVKYYTHSVRAVRIVHTYTVYTGFNVCGVLYNIKRYILQHDEPPPLPLDMPPVPEQFAAPSDKTPPPTREPPVAKPIEEPTPTRSPIRQAPPPPPSSQLPPPSQAPPQEPTHEPVATATKEVANSKGKRKSFFKFGSKK